MKRSKIGKQIHIKGTDEKREAVQSQRLYSYFACGRCFSHTSLCRQMMVCVELVLIVLMTLTA